MVSSLTSAFDRVVFTLSCIQLGTDSREGAGVKLIFP